MSLVIHTEKIVEALQERMNALTFRWKDSDSTQTYNESKPRVYAFTYDDLDNSMPLHTPAVCVQLLSVNDDGLASYLVHICVCNPALQDREITKPITDDPDHYSYDTGDGFDSAGVRSELYKYCLLLAEQVYLSLKQMGNTNHDIRNVQLQTPSPYLSDFPYADCTVSFDSDTKFVIECTNSSELEDML
jgi:hypothetical protein